jgi:hypothetical protein
VGLVNVLTGPLTDGEASAVGKGKGMVLAEALGVSAPPLPGGLNPWRRNGDGWKGSDESTCRSRDRRGGGAESGEGRTVEMRKRGKTIGLLKICLHGI